MVDLNARTIQQLFEQQIRELTQKTMIKKEESFDFQLSGGVVTMNIKDRINYLLQKYEVASEKQTFIDDYYAAVTV